MPNCTLWKCAVERAAARRNNGRRSPDARCFDRPHSSFLLCINKVVCTVCMLVRKWMGNAIFRKDFIQFVQHYPSTSVRYMTDSTILVWRLLLLFPAAVAAVWQKNSPLLYCLDVLRDQQKKLIHAISILDPHWILQIGQKHERSLRSEKSMISVHFITLEKPKGLKGLDGMGEIRQSTL